MIYDNLGQKKSKVSHHLASRQKQIKRLNLTTTIVG